MSIYDDDFSDGRRGNQWEIYSDSQWQNEVGGKLAIDVPSALSYVTSGYKSKFIISGDFDIQTDFSGLIPNSRSSLKDFQDFWQSKPLFHGANN